MKIYNKIKSRPLCLRYLRKYIIFIIILVLTGCSQKDTNDYQHVGASFYYKADYFIDISYIDKYYKYYISKKKPVKVKGRIKHQGEIKGAWAFIEDKGGLVFVDFLASSPNIFLPVKKREEEIAIEGYLQLDDTILNGYKVIPYAYEFVEPVLTTKNTD